LIRRKVVRLMKQKHKRAPGRPAGGSESIVRSVLTQTLQHLGDRGFAALRMEDVARAARVNKTTVYRRWPDKTSLVLAALKASRDRATTFKETGDLREDLVRLFERKAAALSTARGGKIARALASLEGAEATTMAAEIQALRFQLPTQVLHRAIERGDLPKDLDFFFVNEMLHAPIVHRILMLNLKVDRTYIRRVVDLMLTSLGYHRAPSRGHGRAG
jgi:AcrR family transcriptional regulator